MEAEAAAAADSTAEAAEKPGQKNENERNAAYRVRKHHLQIPIRAVIIKEIVSGYIAHANVALRNEPGQMVEHAARGRVKWRIGKLRFRP